VDVWSHLAFGFSIAFSLQNLAYCFIGVVLGTLIGVLPGIGPLVAIGMLFPITFHLPAVSALIMLAGIYYGAQYGGSTTSILINLPGESAAAATCLDGYQMARQGRAGPALAVAAAASFFAGCVGTLLVALFGPPIAEWALHFGPWEYASLMVMGLVAAAAIVQSDVVKGLAAVTLGLLLGLVGADVNSGMMRYTFGFLDLADGIGFTVIAVGLFAVAEVVRNLAAKEPAEIFVRNIVHVMPTAQDLKTSSWPTVRGTAVGALFGVLPGSGPALPSFLSYILEKKIAREPARFGKGAIEGVAAPEAANNAAAQTSFIPMLTLGIPASPTMALMMGAMIMQGIAPGPQVMTTNPELFWGVIASMWIGNLMLVVLNVPLAGVWARLVMVPYRWLFPAIIMLCCVGTYSVNNNPFDVYLCALIGALGYVLLKLECEPAPLVLGYVLGPLLEEYFRRAMLLARGDPTVFFTRPLSLAFLIATGVILAAVIVPAGRKRPF
jgi:putative tricarboxylic transport membrane protein